VTVLLATAVLAVVLWRAGELTPGTLRATYFLYLAGLALAALIILRWTKFAVALVAVAAIELGPGIATPLLPENVSDPQRLAWHALLQAVPIPSLDLVTSNGVHIHHTSQGTRGREPSARELAGRTIVAAFGGSSTTTWR
jgi:hypothetical protein